MYTLGGLFKLIHDVYLIKDHWVNTDTQRSDEQLLSSYSLESFVPILFKKGKIVLSHVLGLLWVYNPVENTSDSQQKDCKSDEVSFVFQSNKVNF